MEEFVRWVSAVILETTLVKSHFDASSRADRIRLWIEINKRPERWIGESDLPRRQRLARWAIHFPGDIAFERSEPAAIVRDIVMSPLIPLLTGPSIGTVLLGKWVASKIPPMINVARCLAHRNPKAAKGSWKRDWTYFTRPRAHQPDYIIKQPRKPMEQEAGAKIPRWIKALSTRAERDGRLSVAGFFDDWLCARSRVAGFIVDMSFVTMSLGFHLMSLTRVMEIDTVMVLIPGVIGAWIGVRNHDLMRALRGGVFQRAGDVIIQEKEAGKELGQKELDGIACPSDRDVEKPEGPSLDLKVVQVSGRRVAPKSRGMEPKAPERGPASPRRNVRPDRGPNHDGLH